VRQAEELAATQKVHEATVDKQRDAAKKLAEVRPVLTAARYTHRTCRLLVERVDLVVAYGVFVLRRAWLFPGFCPSSYLTRSKREKRPLRSTPTATTDASTVDGAPGSRESVGTL
jgi:hypothetical protein